MDDVKAATSGTWQSSLSAEGDWGGSCLDQTARQAIKRWRRRSEGGRGQSELRLSSAVEQKAIKTDEKVDLGCDVDPVGELKHEDIRQEASGGIREEERGGDLRR